MTSVPVTAGAVDPMAPRPCRIRRLVRETHDTVTLELDAGEQFPAFEPGQFNMLYAFGVGEVAISMSGDPSRRGTLGHTIRAVGTVTTVIARMRRGASIGVRGPFGRAWPLADASGMDVVLVAGGIGLAPLRPALLEIAARRRDFRNVVLLYGARSPADVLFRRDLERWRASVRVDVAVTVDHAIGAWPGHVGIVPTFIPRAPFDADNAIALVCGPEVMMRFAAEALRKRGMPAERIFVSLERNMKCAVGFCGHCQFGPSFVCKDGPVFPYDRVKRLLELREI